MTSRFQIKRRDALLLAVFYTVVGLLQIAILVLSSSSIIPPHVGALAILSLIAAYGLLRAKKWSVWLVIVLFFPQIVFGAFSLYATMILYALIPDVALLLANVALAFFMILSFLSFVYVAAKRKTFQ